MTTQLGNENIILFATVNKLKSTQSRILELAPNQKIGGKSSLLVGINGVLSDCVSLVKQAAGEIQSINQSSTYLCTPEMCSFQLPMSSSKMAKRMAMYIAEKCQENNFGGGIRCFGSEIVICDTADRTIFVTETSGSITEYSSIEKTDGEFVIGGEETKRIRLGELLRKKKNGTNTQKKSESACGCIKVMIKVLIDSLLEIYGDDDIDKSLEDLEILISHSSKGVVRLTGDALVEMMKS